MFCGTPARGRPTVQDEVNLRVPVIYRQHDGYNPHVNERGIGNVIAQKRAKLLQNKTLHT
jgi:hypothetical protein